MRADSSFQQPADIGVIGLAVMGQNLILNMADHGFTVAAFNRTVSKIREFLDGPAKGTTVVGAGSMEHLVSLLKRPRRVLLMVKAGPAVDEFIGKLVTLLEPGDIILDGGNSHFADTDRRYKELSAMSLLYIGMGVSGGEEGARRGPSIMPGGSMEAWTAVAPLLTAIAAKAQPGGEPCCQWVGGGGAGHFVKMVHNGIEYGDMQLIGEAYHVMRDLLKLSNEEMSNVYAEWNRGVLNSFLIEITVSILKHKSDGTRYDIDRILDVAGQKGTGRWTVQAALDLASPATLIAEAVFARGLSGLREERLIANKTLIGPNPPSANTEKSLIINQIRDALFASKIVSYAQGFAMLKQASSEYSWGALDLGAVALMWRGGCIIRSAFLGDIESSLRDNDDLLTAPFFRDALGKAQEGWRGTIARAVTAGIPVPAMSAALAYYDGLRCIRLPANLIQAQRDYFGAHTFEFVENPGISVHLDWSGTGGTTSSSVYQA